MPYSIGGQYALLLSGLLYFFSVNVRRVHAKHYVVSLDSLGLAAVNQQSAQPIVQGSRIGWLGCWLYLAPVNDVRKQPTKLFIFKDSVSKQDYARLCRHILRFQKYNLQDVTQ
ncbi:hypothetical protein Q4489_10385 [Thalassotalea sp. 1_MG-2023]|nr:hypothetical protein [Thalassotalea sp. 1_MG-2023]MDO6427424.1 hypothetical protein [Thalassotalea sp. 1_MG-2023]